MTSFINFSLVILSCFLALPLGAVVSWMAKEELKPGLKYFFALQNLLFGLSIFVLANVLLSRTSLNIALSSAMAILISAIAMMGMFFFKTPSRDILIYALFALILSYSAMINQNVLLIQGVIIFLYGLPTASIRAFFYTKQSAQRKKMLQLTLRDIGIKFSFFILLAIICFFILFSYF